MALWNVTGYYVTLSGEFSLQPQGLFFIHLESKFWSSSGLCKGLAFLFPRWLFSCQMISSCIIYVSATPEFIPATQTVAPIFKHTQIPSLTWNTHFDGSQASSRDMPTTESLEARPSLNLSFHVFPFLVRGTVYSPFRSSVQKSGSHPGFISSHNMLDSIHEYFLIFS